MHIPDQESRGHIQSTKIYYLIGFALLILTVVTVAASYVNWGSFLLNIIVAMLIATVKATLVMLYFMHMKHEDRLVWGFGIIYPITIFAILVTFVFLDLKFRNKPDRPDPSVRVEEIDPVQTQAVADAR